MDFRQKVVQWSCMEHLANCSRYTNNTKKKLSFPFCSLSIHNITVSAPSLALWQVKKSNGLPTRVITNSCQERSSCFKHILGKGGDDKVKLHGLSCYCGYSLYPIWLKMLQWLILGSETRNKATASGSLHTAQGRVTPGAGPTLSLSFN